MEIAFLVIAVIGLLALTGGGNIGGGLSVRTAGGPQPLPDPSGGYANSTAGDVWTPSPAPISHVPMVPSQTSNVDGQIFSGVGSVGTQIAAKSITQNLGTGIGATAATAGIAAGVGIIVGIATTLLAQHKARMQGAKNENAAVDQYVPIFDSFVRQLVAAYNAKQCTAAQAANAAQQMDHYIKQTFQSFVGQPGTSWNDTIGYQGQCNKQCTVGCCVYYGDLGPVLNNISFVLGFPTGRWGQGDPRISGRTITVPKVYPSKYSPYTRELYTLRLN